MNAPSRQFGAWLCLALLVLLDALQLHAVWVAEGLRTQDFFGLWSFAQFLRAHAPGQIYQPVLLNQFQHQLDPGFGKFFPFAYPPDFLLPLWPLRWLGYGAARLLWTGLSAALFGVVVWRGLQPGWRLFGLAFVLLAPASLNNFITGETGFFTSALLLGGFLLLPQRQILAGVCFGLLTLKPQLCVLLPFALLGLGAWRAILAAALTALALVVFSCLVLPPDMWPGWWAALHQYQGLAAQNAAHLAPLMTDFAATALSFGIAGPFPMLAGLALVGGLCFAQFRRGEYALAAAALLAGTFAATPHGFFYDALVAGVAVLTLWQRSGPARLDILLGLALLFLPLFAGGAAIKYNLASFVFLALFLRLGAVGRRA